MDVLKNDPLSCFNPVTRDKVGKKKIERETSWETEREKDITRGDRIIQGDRNLCGRGGRNGPVPL